MSGPAFPYSHMSFAKQALGFIADVVVEDEAKMQVWYGQGEGMHSPKGGPELIISETGYGFARLNMLFSH
jgi:hypothetical protein